MLLNLFSWWPWPGPSVSVKRRHSRWRDKNPVIRYIETCDESEKEKAFVMFRKDMLKGRAKSELPGDWDTKVRQAFEKFWGDTRIYDPRIWKLWLEFFEVEERYKELRAEVLLPHNRLVELPKKKKAA